VFHFLKISSQLKTKTKKKKKKKKNSPKSTESNTQEMMPMTMTTIYSSPSPPAGISNDFHRFIRFAFQLFLWNVKILRLNKFVESQVVETFDPTQESEAFVNAL
jgi:hypothetical protein